uniref:glutamine synthetase family protein n=1 Tax=Rhodococcus qingshengii TaxID=334542 RepID=UPI001C4E2E23|nr:glutamine synthetase family protein [Rhodococcus qingshengii]
MVDVKEVNRPSGTGRSEVEQWLRDRGIRSVSVGATNLENTLVGKIVTPDKFLSGMESGFAVADVGALGLDLGNTPQFGFAWPEWRGEMIDVLMRPDVATLIEYGPGKASVIADFHRPAGGPLGVCPRNAVKRLAGDLGALGFETKIAIEIEATVFEESYAEARAKGFRDLTPLGGRAGNCYNLFKLAGWDEYLSAVAVRLEELDIAWEAYNDEGAVGQVEINLAPVDALRAADNWARARHVMREVASEQGHCVTFMAKPTDGWGQASHINFSLLRDGQNVFYASEGPSATMNRVIGGLMASLAGVTSLAMPNITSYRRLLDIEGPPTTLTWGVGNKTAAIRAVVEHPRYSRLEYRVPGSDANLYLVIAAVLGGALIGIGHDIPAPAPFDKMAWSASRGVERIPNTISKAHKALSQDTLLPEVLGQELIDYWLGTRQWEWLMWHKTSGDPDVPLSEWELNRYFEFV